jgi:hypothetical protein
VGELEHPARVGQARTLGMLVAAVLIHDDEEWTKGWSDRDCRPQPLLEALAAPGVVIS